MKFYFKNTSFDTWEESAREINLNNQLIINKNDNFRFKPDSNDCFTLTDYIIFDNEIKRKNKKPAADFKNSYYIKSEKQDSFSDCPCYDLTLTSEFIDSVNELDESIDEVEPGCKHISKNYKIILKNANAYYKTWEHRYFKDYDSYMNEKKQRAIEDADSISNKLEKVIQLQSGYKKESSMYKHFEKVINNLNKLIEDGYTYEAMQRVEKSTKTIYINLFNRIEKNDDYLKLEKIAKDLKDLNIMDSASTHTARKILNYFKLDIKDIK